MKRWFLNLLLLPLLIMLPFVAGFWLWPKKKYVTLQEAVKSIAAKRILPALPGPTKPKDLRIISARYGAKSHP
ncbi:MAG: hypothetical protein ACYTEQ_27925 [Planctomycetota bacterium]